MSHKGSVAVGVVLPVCLHSHDIEIATILVKYPGAHSCFDSLPLPAPQLLVTPHVWIG